MAVNGSKFLEIAKEMVEMAVNSWRLKMAVNNWKGGKWLGLAIHVRK